MLKTPRLSDRYDVLDDPRGGPVAHLSGRSTPDQWGHWYALCGRIVGSYRAASLADTDHDRLCLGCSRKARDL
jgi:hypothetical protein